MGGGAGFIGRSIVYAALFLVAAFCLAPLWWALVASLTPSREIFANLAPLSWKAFVPIHPTLQAYVELFTAHGFGRAFFNSGFIVVATLAIGLAINGLAGFAFAKFEFAGRDMLFFVVLITFMVPFEAIAIPLYVLVKWLGWANTYAALIIPAAPNGLVIFIFRQLYAALPNSLIESAKVDGASWSRIFARIILPLSKPALIGAGLIIFVYQWEMFLWPLIVANTPELRTIQVALSLLQAEYQTFWDRLFAAVVLTVILPIAIILPLQRYYVSGMSTTGIKDE